MNEKVRAIFKQYGLAKRTTYDYSSALTKICKETDLENPFKLLERPLEEIENEVEKFIRANEGKLAPKSLNKIYSAVKAWLHANRKIKNRKLFREIKFDKSSNVSSGLLLEMLETHHMKNMISLADADDEIVLGLYGLVALRPSLIPILRVRHIHPRSFQLENGKITLVKPTLVIVPRKENGQHVEGNKAKIDFPIFIPSKIAEKIEMTLNQNKVTLETKICKAINKRAVTYVVKKYYAEIGFNGVPYRMRNYGDDLLDRITRQYADEDFKEFLMGHKGKISAVYQHKGLTLERERRYRDMYVNAVDKWINQNIYGAASKEELDKADMLKRFAIGLGIREDRANEIYQLMQVGKMSIEQFQTRLTEMTKEAQNNRIRELIRDELKRMNGGQ